MCNINIGTWGKGDNCADKMSPTKTCTMGWQKFYFLEKKKIKLIDIENRSVDARSGTGVPNG